MCDNRTQFVIFRSTYKRIKITTDNVIYTIDREDIKLILKYKDDDINLLLINVLFVSIKINLISITRLIKKNIEIYLRNINKPSLIIADERIVDYTNIKNDLY